MNAALKMLFGRIYTFYKQLLSLLESLRSNLDYNKDYNLYIHSSFGKQFS